MATKSKKVKQTKGKKKDKDMSSLQDSVIQDKVQSDPSRQAHTFSPSDEDIAVDFVHHEGGEEKSPVSSDETSDEAPDSDILSAQTQESVDCLMPPVSKAFDSLDDTTQESDSFFSLSPEEQDFLTRLPYRVGYWISHVDQVGGTESDEAEMEALYHIIRAYTEDTCKCEFVQRIMESALAREEEWEVWQESIETVLEECTRAIDLLRPHLINSDLKGFRKNLMEIAYTVARAYCERQDKPRLLGDLEKLVQILHESFRLILKGKTPLPAEDLKNISLVELRAIRRLSQALRIEDDESKSVQTA